MARTLTLAVLAAAVLAVTASASDVLEVTDASFGDAKKAAELVLVEFYAPWCGHCKKLAPEWEEAATLLKTAGAKAVLGKVDATVERKITEEMGIRGYPTIKIFRDGELSGDYEGPRNAAGIVQWINANTGPAIVTIETAEQLETLKKEHAVVVAFFNTDSDAAATLAFDTVAKRMRSTVRFVSTSAVSLHPEGLSGKVVAFKQFDEGQEVYAGAAAETDALANFVKSATMRLFDEMGPENYRNYIDRGLPISWLFMDPKSDSSAPVKASMTTLAAELKGKISLVWIDSSKYSGMAQRLGLSGNVFPAVAVDFQDKHFAFDEKAELSLEGLRTFYTKYLAGELTATIKSEPVPAVHTVDGLTTVVGSTFDELVRSKDADVLVEFYAPWCGHCKALAPVYKSLAKRLANVEGLRIAQFDASNNDFDQKTFNVQGFPTLMFLKKDDATGTPIPYEGGRTADEILAFLKAQSSADFSKIEEAKDEL